MLLSVSPGATTCTPAESGREALPAGAGMISRSPALIATGPERLLACRMAATGTPCLRDTDSSVSPGAMVMAVPLFASHLPCAEASRGTEPVMSPLPRALRADVFGAGGGGGGTGAVA